MRIIGGKFRGKSLLAPTGRATRPTTDRVRENVFNILSNRISFDGLRVLDLFAGSGALGFEAVSRGAGFCLFVENSSSARAAIRTNIEALGLSGAAKIYRRDAEKLGSIGTLRPFDLVFADPPYGKGLVEKASTAVSTGGWLSDNAIFIAEENSQSMPETLAHFDTLDVRSYGDTSVGLFEYKG